MSQGVIDAGRASVTARASGTVAGQSTQTAWRTASRGLAAHPALAVSQWYNLTRDADGDGKVSVGDTIGFAYQISNAGNVTLGSPAVTSRLLRDRGLKVSCQRATLYTQASRPGQRVRCWTPGFVVKQGQLANGRIVNAAVVSARTASDRSVSATSTVVIAPIHAQATTSRSTTKTRIGRPGMSIVTRVTHVTDEYDKNGVTNTGDKVSVQFTVANTGQLALHAITVSDTMLKRQSIGINCPASALAAGQSMVCSADAQYTVTRADFSSGHLKSVSVARAVVDATGRTIGSRAKLDRPLGVPIAETVGSSTNAASLAYTGSGGLGSLATMSGLLMLAGCGTVIASRRRQGASTMEGTRPAIAE